jgi:hypothetical protein
VARQGINTAKSWCTHPEARQALPMAAVTVALLAAAFAVNPAVSQEPSFPPDTKAPAPSPAPAKSQPAAQSPSPAPAAPSSPLPSQPAFPAQTPAQPPNLTTPPIAIVPLDGSLPGAAISVGGAMQAWRGRAYITANGAITAGPSTAQVTLPYRGTLRVCPSTTVRLSVDTSVPSSEIPGLLIAIENGALEASFAVARNSDVLLTPNFRIMVGGPGSSDVKVRLGQNGDTCVDNSGANAPYVVVTSVFDTGLYRVQPGQRVMFENGDLHTVVDQEKEPCGCPPSGQKGNEFPLAQSEGMAPPTNLPPTTQTTQPAGSGEGATTLVYNAPGNQTPQPAAIPQPPAAPQTTPGPAPQAAQTQQAQQKKPGFFSRIGRFFKRVFGAE